MGGLILRACLINPIIFLVAPAEATTIRSDALTQAIRRADLEAEIKIEKVTSEGHGSPQTIALSRVERVIRSVVGGDPPRWVELEIPGGEVTGGYVHYSGTVYPTVGSRYRATLARHGERFRVVGLESGLVPLGFRRTFVRNRVEGCSGSNPAYIHWDFRFMPIPFVVASASFESAPELIRAILPSFESWRNVDGAGVDFTVLGCTHQVANENDGLNNIVLVTGGWPFMPEAIAVTRNFFIGCSSPFAGQILDSDILLNGVNHRFSVGPLDGHHDLQNILTHEIGHLLGLGHETDEGDKDATMYKDAEFLETKKRRLKVSDVAGIRESYPFTLSKAASIGGFQCEYQEVRPMACAATRRAASAFDSLFFFWLGCILWLSRRWRRVI